jgi:hypothetical protein
MRNAVQFLNPDELEPARELLAGFARRYPQFGINPDAPHSFTHLRRTHEETLTRSGACVKTQAGHWLGHRDRFPEVLLAILLGQPIPRAPTAATTSKVSRSKSRKRSSKAIIERGASPSRP